MTPQPLEAEFLPGPTDAELLEATAAGDEAAFAELRARYRPAVGRVCRSIAARDREDCEQEVFARIWRKAPLFDRRRGSAPSWLLTVARRTALSAYGRRQFPPLPVEDEELDEAVEPEGVDAFWIAAALERLADRERTVIELAYYEDLTESAIAARLRVPLGTVKTWKRRALGDLATLLGEELA